MPSSNDDPPLSGEDDIALHGALILHNENAQMAYLASVCGSDHARLKRLQSYLQYQTDADAFFTPLNPLEASATGFAIHDTAASDAAPNDTAPSDTAPSDAAAYNSRDSLDTMFGMPPREIGKFAIQRVLGSGGMGTVFLAKDTILDRLVALKVPRIELITNARSRQHFLREAKLAAQLEHPGLVAVLEVGAIGAITFIASEWCESGDLANWLSPRESACEPVEVAIFAAKLCDALSHIHACGIVHLDLKPSNIMLRPKNARQQSARRSQEPGSQEPGSQEPAENLLNVPINQLSELEPLLADFGVSRAIDGRITKASSSVALGTLLYMAPEQLLPSLGDVGPRSDIFAMGSVLAEMLCLDLPREGADYVAIVGSLENAGALESSIRPWNVPSDMRTILAKCMSIAPENRYGSAAELAQDLRAFAHNEPIRAKPSGQIAFLKAWAGQKKRVREAWWITLGTNAVITAWMLAGLYLITGENFPGNNRTQAMVASVGLLLVNTVPMFTFAILGLRGNRWTLLPALSLVFIAMVFVPSLVLSGTIEAVPGLYENSPFFEALNHALVLGFGLVQFTALAVANYCTWKSPKK